MFHAPVVALVTRGDCLKYPSNVRVGRLTAQEYPESAKSLRLGAFDVDVEAAILPDGTQCGPRIAKSSGRLSIDNAAMAQASVAFHKSVAAGGLQSAVTYLYRVRFTPPVSP